MASLISTVFNEALSIAVNILLDKAELQSGTPVKCGQVGTTDNEPVYVYLSTNANLT